MRQRDRRAIGHGVRSYGVGAIYGSSAGLGDTAI
jgi:hypothetical protein